MAKEDGAVSAAAWTFRELDGAAVSYADHVAVAVRDIEAAAVWARRACFLLTRPGGAIVELTERDPR